jgi:hypothetical protein
LRTRQRVTADKDYGAGCRIEPEALGRNLAALLRVGAVAWMPPGTPLAATPRDIPPPPPAPAKRPKLKIIHLSDPVQAWHETFREMRKHFLSDSACEDFILSFEEGRALYKIGCRLAVLDAKAKMKGKMQSVSPNQVGF